ncbi:hypothetical protein, partial [Sulfitobacter pontiacus]|uniref:hypothetical protein n=1 Tax=Sulfitobacter pontiacus TaxID=60137 RepID=UPI003BF55F85
PAVALELRQSGVNGAPLTVFSMPPFQGVLRWIPQLTDGGLHALAELDIKLNRAQSFFVAVHGLSPR